MGCKAAAFSKTCELQAQSSNRVCSAQRGPPLLFFLLPCVYMCRFRITFSCFVLSQSSQPRRFFSSPNGGLQLQHLYFLIYYYSALRFRSQLPALLQSLSFFCLSSVAILHFVYATCRNAQVASCVEGEPCYEGMQYRRKAGGTTSPVANLVQGLSNWRGSRDRRLMAYLPFVRSSMGLSQKTKSFLIPHGNQAEPQIGHVDENPLTAHVAEDLYFCK